MSQDPWLQNYDATCRLVQEIAENIHERNRQQRTGGNPAKINMTLRASLQKLKQNINQLRESLLRASSSRRIMQSEADRRQNLVDDLVTRDKQLNATFKGDVTHPELSRSTLMPGAGGEGGASANPWLVNEPEETRGLGFSAIKQQQQRIVEVQDAGLDALAAVISRQKLMGQDIGNELDGQNGKEGCVCVCLLLLLRPTLRQSDKSTLPFTPTVRHKLFIILCMCLPNKGRVYIVHA
uniref:Syntaxin 8 n=1 Tax=Oncorhynchus mykiss TaxID=8022 RepID=A0A8C7V437_ONCMY